MFDQDTLAQLEAGYQRQRGLAETLQQGAGRAGGAKGLALDLLPFGRVIEKKVNPNAGSITGGELLSEALLTALPFGLGKATKLVRAGKGASSASKAIKSAPVKRTQKVANELTARGGGFKVGPQVGGTSRMDDAADVYQRHNITGTPKQQLKKIDKDIMPTLSKKVDDVLVRNDVPMSGSTVRTNIKKAVDDPLKYPELDLSTPGAQRYLNSHLKKYASAKNAKDVNDYIKTLNPTAIRAQDKLARGVPLTDKETAALAAKKAGDEVLSEIAEIKPLKKDMAILFDRYAETSAQVGKKSGIPVVGGIVSAPASGARYVESKVGQLLSRKGAKELPQSTDSLTRALLRTTGQQAGVRAGADILGMRDKGVVPEKLEQALMPPSEDALLSDMTMEGTDPLDAATESTGPLDPLSLQDNVQQILAQGGSVKDAQEYVSLVKALQDVGGTKEQKLSAAQKQSLGKINTANAILDRFETMLGEVDRSDFGPAARVQGLASTIGAVTGLDQQAKVYNDLRNGLMAQLAKALGESGALAQGDIDRALSLVPSLGETPNERSRKMMELRALISGMKQGITGV